MMKLMFRLMRHYQLDVNRCFTSRDGARRSPLCKAISLATNSAGRLLTRLEAIVRLLLAHKDVDLEVREDGGLNALDAARICPWKPIRDLVEDKYRSYCPEGVIEYVGEEDSWCLMANLGRK